MKYAISYYKSFRHFDKIDEIIFKYTDKNVNLLEVLEKISPEQRLIIDVTERSTFATEFELFHNLWRRHNNMSIKVSMEQREILPDLYEEHLPFFFEEFVDTWDKLVSMTGLGVTDVYIVSDLCFDLKNVSIYCKKHNVKIRVFPNIAQTSALISTQIDSITQFFIRPEDIEIYEEYIDICEFFGDLDRQSVLYEIYTKGKWLGDLQHLILNFKYSLQNQTIAPIFANTRLSCNKKCNQGKCNICHHIVSTGRILAENNLVIRKEKEDNEYKTNETVAEDQSE